MSSISQQIVNKLLKAHTLTNSTEASNNTTTIKRSNKNNSTKRKRSSSSNNNAKNDRIATEEEIVQWHINLMVTTDRIMAKAVDATTTNQSSKSHAAAYAKLQQRNKRREQQQEQIQKHNHPMNNILPCGSARTSASTIQQQESVLVKVPTYNKVQYEKNRKVKKQMKLAIALERLHNNKMKKSITTTSNIQKKKKKKKINEK